MKPISTTPSKITLGDSMLRPQHHEKAELESPPAPLFIFGCSRSGTSLLSRMIDCHPKVAIPFESHIFNTFHAWLSHYGDLKNVREQEALIDDILRSTGVLKWDVQPTRDVVMARIRRPDFGGIVEAMMSAYAELCGKSRWGEKTPGYIGWWREILQAFPDMKAIHIVRDPRDVAVSLCRARFGPAHVFPAAKRWRSYVKRVEKMRTKLREESFLQVRYEDLLQNPEPVLQEVCHFLGESFSPEMLAFHASKKKYPTDRRNFRNLNQPLMTGNAQKWKKTLSRREIRLVEAASGPALERYGYEATIPNAAVSRTESLACDLIEHPPRRLLGAFKNFQGLISGMRKLGIYARIRLRKGFLMKGSVSQCILFQFFVPGVSFW